MQTAAGAQCPQISQRAEGRRMEPCRPRRQPPATPWPARQSEPRRAGRVYHNQVKEASYPEKAVNFSTCDFCYDYKQGGNCPIHWVKLNILIIKMDPATSEAANIIRAAAWLVGMTAWYSREAVGLGGPLTRLPVQSLQ